MPQISIDLSGHQLRKMRKGHKVRVKKGEGLCLMVHPSTFNLMTRSFNKNKGVEIALSPEELEHNADVLQSKNVQQPISRLSPADEDEENHIEEEPVMPVPIGKGLRGNRRHGGNIASSMNRANMMNTMNHHLQKNYDYLNTANIGTALANKANAKLSKLGIDARHALSPVLSHPNELLGPRSRDYIRGGTVHEVGSVGRDGGMLGGAYMPPALVSQPFSANWQMQFFVPPQYQMFNNGGSHEMMGTGLYAGRGIYAGSGIYAGGNLKDKLSGMWNKIPQQYHAPLEQIGKQGLQDMRRASGYGLYA